MYLLLNLLFIIISAICCWSLSSASDSTTTTTSTIHHHRKLHNSSPRAANTIKTAHSEGGLNHHHGNHHIQSSDRSGSISHPTKAPTKQLRTYPVIRHSSPTATETEEPPEPSMTGPLEKIYKTFPKHTPHPKVNIWTAYDPYQDVHSSIFDFKYKFNEYFNFTKVLIPAIYKEYENFGLPPWITNEKAQQHLGYSVFQYQQVDPLLPNYLPRTTPGGVYLQYIVDHYDNFPDIGIFVHSIPNRLNPYWFEQIGCIKQNASYININFKEMKLFSTAEFE